jgi:hypothetical protein
MTQIGMKIVMIVLTLVSAERWEIVGLLMMVVIVMMVKMQWHIHHVTVVQVSQLDVQVTKVLTRKQLIHVTIGNMMIVVFADTQVIQMQIQLVIRV